MLGVGEDEGARERDGTNRDHGGPANRGVLHEALPFGLVALYTWHFGPSSTPPSVSINDAYRIESYICSILGREDM